MNRILMLKDDEGREFISEGSQGHNAAEYFTSSQPSDFSELLDGLTARISPAMNGVLSALVMKEEIKNASFSIKESSALGPDGLTGAFYNKFWNIVGPTIIVEIQKFFSSSFIPPD